MAALQGHTALIEKALDIAQQHIYNRKGDSYLITG